MNQVLITLLKIMVKKGKFKDIFQQAILQQLITASVLKLTLTKKCVEENQLKKATLLNYKIVNNMSLALGNMKSRLLIN